MSGTPLDTADFRFEVALSFAGDSKRDIVRAVAEILREELGAGRVFFDEWFEAELAGHDAQVVLQSIYCRATRLVVTCVCKRYAEKPWTQEEWRAIQAFERDLRDAGSGNLRRMRFLPLRFGDGDVDGLFATAIVPDVRPRSPRTIAALILERLRLARGERALGSPSQMPDARAVSPQAPTATSVSGTATSNESVPTAVTAAAADRISDPADGAERPPWAAAAGRDKYGRWAAFEVGGVQQRLRWIPPGRFLMGSPPTEVGRYDNEGPQHWVTIAKGYWLGETPVTQALWRAVMQSNPSRFVSDDRPVEQVSWDDCGKFIGWLNRLLDGFEARLPTEAEWERACRAGTTAATWVGNLTLRGLHNAPELDAIAWYGGNSGVGFDLDNGQDSSGWSEKQYPHTRAGTHPVGLLQANPYGLHDMLGNVWEWCQDAAESLSEPYAPEPAVDPVSPHQGANRVSRGGSWDGVARRVRAAYRDAFLPGDRFVGFGFRLAGGQVPAPR